MPTAKGIAVEALHQMARRETAPVKTLPESRATLRRTMWTEALGSIEALGIAEVLVSTVLVSTDLCGHLFRGHQAASPPSEISPVSLTSSKRIDTCLLTPDSCMVTP